MGGFWAPLRRLLGGSEWDFRNPYLPQDEAERFRRRLLEFGVHARWEGDVLLITDPRNRWQGASIAPKHQGLYGVGAFGRPVRSGSGYLRQWEEVAPLPRGRLEAKGIARALDTGLPLGPNFDRIEREVEGPTLIEAISLAQTEHARERLCILLAHHPRPADAVAALPELAGFLDSKDHHLRSGAASAIATITSRAGRKRALASAPDLAAALREGLDQAGDRVIDDDLRAALGALGESVPAPNEHAEWFAGTVQGVLGFLTTEYGFDEATVEDQMLSTKVSYRNQTTAVVANADWRDAVVEIFLVKLEAQALPLYLETELTHWLGPSLLLHEEEGEDLEMTLPDPRDRDGTRRFLQQEAESLRKCGDVLGGDFRRFDRALGRLRGDR